jgi:drug/metabolite transporter superfamily protein YnfA
MPGGISNDSSPADRLMRLLPTEVTGLYITVRGVVESSALAAAPKILVATAITVSLVAIPYLVKVQKVTNAYHIAIYVATFLVWAATLDAIMIDDEWAHTGGVFPVTLCGLAFIWTFAIPLALPSAPLSSGPTP